MDEYQKVLNIMNSIDHATINQLILHKQHLTQESKQDDIIQIIKDLCGLQATGTFEPYVYLFCRKKDFKKEELDYQLYALKNLIKIRAMRNTLFISPLDYAPMMHTATNYHNSSGCCAFNMSLLP